MCIKRLGAAALELLYPPGLHCLVCGAAAGGHFGLCVACEEELCWLSEAKMRCQRCGREVWKPVAGNGCPECARWGNTDCWARAAVVYEDAAARLVHALKYQGKQGLAEAMGGMMAAAIEPPLGRWTLVPVPLHPKRERERGFNQALLIAETLGREWQFPVAALLRRRRPTQQQAQLSVEARWANVRGKFSLLRPNLLLQGRFLLVDDVLTTGATALECARLLKEAGAAEVGILSFAVAGLNPAVSDSALPPVQDGV